MKKIITQIAIFTLIFCAIFALSRGFMQGAFIDLANKSDIFQMYIQGLRMDLKVIAIGFAPLLLLGYIALLWQFVSAKLRQDSALKRIESFIVRIYPAFSSLYIDIMAILASLFSFIAFYYYDMFKTKIDIFIFGLKDDDTSAVLSIIFNDYPIALILACVAIFCAFCVWVNNKILKSPPPRSIYANLAIISPNLSHTKANSTLCF